MNAKERAIIIVVRARSARERNFHGVCAINSIAFSAEKKRRRRDAATYVSRGCMNYVIRVVAFRLVAISHRLAVFKRLYLAIMSILSMLSKRKKYCWTRQFLYLQRHISSLAIQFLYIYKIFSFSRNNSFLIISHISFPHLCV